MMGLQDFYVRDIWTFAVLLRSVFRPILLLIFFFSAICALLTGVVNRKTAFSKFTAQATF